MKFAECLRAAQDKGFNFVSIGDGPIVEISDIVKDAEKTLGEFVLRGQLIYKDEAGYLSDKRSTLYTESRVKEILKKAKNES